MSTKMIYFAVAAVLLYVLFGRSTVAGSPAAPGALASGTGAGSPASPGSLAGLTSGLSSIFAGIFKPAAPIPAPGVASGTIYGPTMTQLTGLSPAQLDVPPAVAGSVYGLAGAPVDLTVAAADPTSNWWTNDYSTQMDQLT